MTYVQTTLIPTKSKWKYRDAAVAPPSNWFSATYNDLSWATETESLDMVMEMKPPPLIMEQIKTTKHLAIISELNLISPT